MIDDNKDVLNSLSLLNSRAIKLQNDFESMPSWDNYEPLECLGEGSYGKIFKVREKYGETAEYLIEERLTGPEISIIGFHRFLSIMNTRQEEE